VFACLARMRIATQRPRIAYSQVTVTLPSALLSRIEMLGVQEGRSVEYYVETGIRAILASRALAELRMRRFSS
jgi:hypothetical protein